MTIRVFPLTILRSAPAGLLAAALLAQVHAAPPVFTEVYNFSGLDGISPSAGLLSANGALYGATQSGGSSDFGTVFQLIPPGSGTGVWSETVLYSFKGADGARPNGRLVAGQGGVLYGTTQVGGSSNRGTVFQLTPPAAQGANWTETVLYSFKASGGDGQYPNGGMVKDAKGNLFGTTYRGGVAAIGTVFELTPPTVSGGAWTESLLYSFAGGSDGASPLGDLVADRSGVLYGVTVAGGTSNNGTIYNLSPPATQGGKWIEAVLYRFVGGTDGSHPSGGLIFDKVGTHFALYGVTGAGGVANSNCLKPGQSTCGTIFQLAPPSTSGGNWVEKVIYSFTGGADGEFPQGSLFGGKGGALFGTSVLNSPTNNGVLYLLAPPTAVGQGWTETLLHSLTGSSGVNPLGDLIGFNNHLLGVTSGGGSAGFGTVFEY